MKMAYVINDTCKSKNSELISMWNEEITVCVVKVENSLSADDTACIIICLRDRCCQPHSALVQDSYRGFLLSDDCYVDVSKP